MKLVYFDLDTTGLNKPTHEGVEIVSIGAICDEETFHVEMIPTIGISKGASEVNGYRKQGGKLLYRGNEVVEAIQPKDAIKQFLDFLEKQMANDETDAGGDSLHKIVLISHYSKNYDSIVLGRNLCNHDLSLPNGIVLADTYSMMLTLAAKDRRFKSTRRYHTFNCKLANCLKILCGIDQGDVHNALRDATFTRMVAEKAASRLKYQSYENYLRRNWTKEIFRIQRYAKSSQT